MSHVDCEGIGNARDGQSQVRERGSLQSGRRGKISYLSIYTLGHSRCVIKRPAYRSILDTATLEFGDGLQLQQQLSSGVYQAFHRLGANPLIEL